MRITFGPDGAMLSDGDYYGGICYGMGTCRVRPFRSRQVEPVNLLTFTPNGQVERMNRTLKEVTVYRYYYDTHQQLRDHLATFRMAYNFAKRLKVLKRTNALRIHLPAMAEATPTICP